jgi:DNA-binding NarL/FixJ family response regulator
VRVVIADDAALWREGLARLLVEAGIETCALVGDAAALVRAVEEHDPDVALIDVRMPPTFTHEGAEAAVALRERWPELGLLLLSQTLEVRNASWLARTCPRGFGYLLKDRVLDVGTLVDALRTVDALGTVLDPDVVSGLLNRRATKSLLAELSPREREVLELIAQGRTNKAIAQRFALAEKTVERHIASIFLKLGLWQTPDDHRRVLAVLTWLESQGAGV